ncbi:hypothetical protein BY996DRAFT_1265005 [Phakopsora pachyrhizi]|uniref:Uncharacterized protein n=1 Tax=Phakopsora pachyrhizi TaxID=170000 RepID=A0AAV0AXN5_PHAPC|nr:hypothetical protein BY996DRAFT_4601724 [Phakopsora pachyrhizi]KAI8446765.1 hypothetical protein BY996DRAFT_1265005 [Phakopsora pachyrhizi]CAH7674061.1 hypothetical protein PPACK8108_LOCUS8963 [Phakopsora pachyrhizi]
MQHLVYSSSLLASITTLVLSIYSLNAPAWIRFDTPSSSPLQYSESYGLKFKCGRSNIAPDFVCRPFPDRSRDCGASSNSILEDPFFEKLLSADDRQLPLNRSIHQFLHRKNSSSSIKTAPMGSGSIELLESASSVLDRLGAQRFGFCEKWNSAGFCAEMSIVIGAISIFCVSIVLLGNRHRQKHGWKICAGLIAIHAVSQITTWVFVLQIFNTDNRFYIGSKLSTSFYISVASSMIDLICLTGLVAAGIVENDDDDDSNDESNYQPIP